MDALAFVEKSAKAKPAALFALAGDENFLRGLVRDKLVADLLGDADPAFALSSFEGEDAVWSTVKSDLDTLPFLSPRRVAIIEQADPFVTKYRSFLEDYTAAESSKGVLILEVKTWPANTRLAKVLADSQTIQCKSPGPAKLAPWCRKWVKDRYGKELASEAAEWLIELVGGGMGQLDRELDKLVSFVGAAPVITRAHIDQIVGRSRQAEVFKIFDAIGAGRTSDALTILDRLLAEGDAPLAVLGVFSWQLRRLASVSRLVRAGHSMPDAMTQAGVPPFAKNGAEQQLRHLGRARMDRVYDWLIEADLGMKGSSPLPERLLLERLIVILARTDAKPVARR